MNSICCSSKRDDRKVSSPGIQNGRNNLRLDGLLESGKESWNEYEKKVKDFTRNKRGIEHNVTIERSHKTGKLKREDF